MFNPAIVVSAYNRPTALHRLLTSLARAVYPKEPVALVISIDAGPQQPEVKQIAEEFQWVQGPKEVIAHASAKGLRRHIIACGDLSEAVGPIILLEDDLFVSPFFYSYTQSALEAFSDAPRVAGVSLYKHCYNETAALAFEPYYDGFSNFFLQLPSSWGQCWTKDQWRGFRSWYNEHTASGAGDDVVLPPNVVLWSEQSWKKYFIKYMIDRDLYFSYPRSSLTTNFMDPGTHHFVQYNHLQVPLLYHERQFRFSALNESGAVYDAYCEPLPSVLRRYSESLDGHPKEFVVDLYGAKPFDTFGDAYVVTDRGADDKVLSWGRRLKPHECNLFQGISGDDFVLAEREAVRRPRERDFFDSVNFYHSVSPLFYCSVGGKKETAKGSKTQKFGRDLEIELASVERDLEFFRNELDALLNSTSWRVSKPLRSLMAWLRSR